MNVNWNFPNNGCGQIRGISDAGIETFTGSEIRALARETCQNSLDARVEDNGKHVSVEFERYCIETRNVPGFEQYAENLEKAYDYWKDKNSTKTMNFLRKARNEIRKSKSYVLRISDYNTTGLSNPFSDSAEGWNTLTKLDGGATKNGDKAGAFGIGKNAPFCNSNYRLVFYRTLNRAHEIAAQGMSRFISFPLDLNDSLHTMTTGIGYYGNSDGNMPVEHILELDELNKRTEIGTDVFVYGFNSKDNWAKDVICEILENFLMSIYNDLLSVSVDGNTINKSNLSIYMEKYREFIPDAYCYYKVLKSGETKTFSMNFYNMGTVYLKVYVSEKDKLNRKVLITRSSGMRLFPLSHISRIISFSGILEMKGVELNTYFREMETPAHDKWDPNRYSDNPQQAKKHFNDLKKWIKECVQSLGEYSSSEESDVEGLGSILQQDPTTFENDGENKKEVLEDVIGKIEIQTRKKVETVKGLFHGSDGKGKSNTREKKGDITDTGKKNTKRVLGGTRKRKKKESHKGVENPNGHDILNEEYGGNIIQPLENIRIIKKSIGSYRAIFSFPRNVKHGHIEIETIGENGKSNRLKVEDAVGITGCSGVSGYKEGIRYSSLKGNEKIIIEFSLVDTRDYAMEVNIYEHN